MIQQIILQISFYQRTNVDFIVFRITFNTIVWTATPTHRQQKTFLALIIIKRVRCCQILEQQGLIGDSSVQIAIHPISFTNIVPAFIQFTFRTNDYTIGISDKAFLSRTRIEPIEDNSVFTKQSVYIVVLLFSIQYTFIDFFNVVNKSRSQINPFKLFFLKQLI